MTVLSELMKNNIVAEKYRKYFYNLSRRFEKTISNSRFRLVGVAAVDHWQAKRKQQNSNRLGLLHDFER